MKEDATRLDKKVEFRVTDGMYKYLRDFADAEDGDISKIIRGIIAMQMAEKAKDEYYLIDKINEMIKHHEGEIEKLKELKQGLLSKR